MKGSCEINVPKINYAIFEKEFSGRDDVLPISEVNFGGNNEIDVIEFNYVSDY